MIVRMKENTHRPHDHAIRARPATTLRRPPEPSFGRCDEIDSAVSLFLYEYVQFA
jgi:hypothetical protein